MRIDNGVLFQRILGRWTHRMEQDKAKKAMEEVLKAQQRVVEEYERKLEKAAQEHARLETVILAKDEMRKPLLEQLQVKDKAIQSLELEASTLLEHLTVARGVRHIGIES